MTRQEHLTSFNFKTNSGPKGTSKRTWKKAAGFTLSFLLFLSITGVFFSLDLWLGFLNKQTVVTAAAQSGYSEGAFQQLNLDMEALMKAHELNPAPVLDILEENEFYAVSGNRIEKALHKDMEGMDLTSFKEKLQGLIQKQLKQEGIPENVQLDQAVSEIVFAGGDLYEKHADFKFGKEFMRAREQTLPMVRMLFFVSLVASVALLGLLLFAWRRYKGLSLISYSLLGAVLANALAVALLYATNPIERGDTMISSYYHAFVDEYLRAALVPGIGLCLLGLILWGALWMGIRRIQREG